MEWLDAMRGLTMILVVAYHVAQISFGVSERTSSSLPFLVLFRMPLFFFVSGFLAYKASFEWTVPNTLRLTWKKLKIQVLPALVFLCVLILLPKMPQVGEWLNHNRPNFILEIVTSFSVALVVIGFCLLISHILRISPIFRQYLFGRK